MSSFNNSHIARAVSRAMGVHSRALGFAVLLAAGGVAQAQAASATGGSGDTLETVLVTGIRAGIEDAIELKRESTSIVEAISAEDIGKLPDTSIAESISRLPGITSQRAEGRASTINGGNALHVLVIQAMTGIHLHAQFMAEFCGVYNFFIFDLLCRIVRHRHNGRCEFQSPVRHNVWRLRFASHRHQ